MADAPPSGGQSSGAGRHEAGVTAESLLEDADRLARLHCADCGQRVSPPDALLGLALGFRRRAVCFACLAIRMEADPSRLRAHLGGYIKVHHCFREAWDRLAKRPE